MQTLNVKVQTPTQVLYQGPALAVSSKNIEGKFDILPEHANFISLIAKTPIIILKPDKTKLNFNFNQSIIYLETNRVIIFADPVQTI